ncbi:MAG: hypothetical protein ACLQNE_05910 [Thermoguttaceae bacterium]
MFCQKKPFWVSILLVAIVVPLVIEGARADESTAKAAGDDAFEAKVLRALAQPVALDYRKTPLCDALPDLSRRLKIPIVLDRAALKVTGIAADTPVTIEIVGLPAEIVFGRVLGTIGLTWTINKGAILMTTSDEAEKHLRTKVYDVTDLACDRSGKTTDDNTVADFKDFLITLIAIETWEDVGGACSLKGARSAGRLLLTVRQTFRVHREIAAVLAELRRIHRVHREKPDISVVARQPDPWEKDLDAALARPITLDVTNRSLTAVVSDLRTKLNVNLFLDFPAMNESGIPAETRITAKLPQISAGAALKLLLRDIGLTWIKYHGMILITDPLGASWFAPTRLYDVGDLVYLRKPPSRGRVDFQSFFQSIEWAVDPNTFADSRPAICEFNSHGLSVMGVSESEDVHSTIEDLLAALRLVRAAGIAQKNLVPIEPPMPAWEAALCRALERPVKCDFRQAPLAEVLANLGEQLHVPIVISWKDLNEAGFHPPLRTTLIATGFHGRSALDTITERESLAWTFRDEVIWITTPEKERWLPRLRVYDVRDLVGKKPAPFANLPSLLDAIESQGIPRKDANGFIIDSIREYSSNDLLVLVALQDREGREQLERILSNLRGSSKARPSLPRP